MGECDTEVWLPLKSRIAFKILLLSHVCCLVQVTGQVILGNGGAAAEDRAKVLSGKLDWSSSSSESADKKGSAEISGNTEHTSKHRLRV